MNKEFRPDVIWFNSFIITVLCVFAVILVRFEALNIFFAFGLFGVFLLVAVLSYMKLNLLKQVKSQSGFSGGIQKNEKK